MGATDEECAFGQVFEPCEPGETTGCAFRTGFVRQGLKVGLELDQALGFNPLRVGFVAATDSHNANPGDVEEWDFPGAVGSVTSPAIRRLTGNARAGNSDNATPNRSPTSHSFNSIHPVASPPSGHRKTPGKQSLTPWPVGRLMPLQAPALHCASTRAVLARKPLHLIR